MVIDIRAVDVDKVAGFWRMVPGHPPMSVGPGDEPSVRIVVPCLSGSLGDDIATLIAKGAQLIEQDEFEAVLADPAGNKFVLRDEDGLDAALQQH